MMTYETCYQCPDRGTEVCALPTMSERVTRFGRVAGPALVHIAYGLGQMVPMHATSLRQSEAPEVYQPEEPSVRERVRFCQEVHVEFPELGQSAT